MFENGISAATKFLVWDVRKSRAMWVRKQEITFVNHAQHPPALNPHLTKSRLNGAPRLCEMLFGNFR
jgi:hypothetical protein